MNFNHVTHINKAYFTHFYFCEILNWVRIILKFERGSFCGLLLCLDEARLRTMTTITSEIYDLYKKTLLTGD